MRIAPAPAAVVSFGPEEPRMKNGALMLLAGLVMAPPAAAVDMYCVDRDGRCMVVTVNGQKAVKLSKANKKALAGMKAARHYVHDARYELAAPIRGEIEVKADPSARSRDWFGDNRQIEVMVVPLGDVELRTHQQLTTAENVRIQGGAPLTVQNVLDGNRLPPGLYLLLVTLTGEGNWDRMTLYVQVTG
jgi:hypothetical protein